MFSDQTSSLVYARSFSLSPTASHSFSLLIRADRVALEL